ncbi:MAG: hypothetical protein NZ908_01960 [Candidatus Micrarchaeota archaeon]|nr:hypothetical protein [Candidatus Micrarchaeota archaeon]MCX8154530.1 hypothetical protein [Candidatus Micrarchaeota archaeon]
MLYRIPLDRDGLITKVTYISDRNTLSCADHGDMNVVTTVEYRGKKIYWFRCIFCNVGAGYDGDPTTNPTKEEILSLGDPKDYINAKDVPEPLWFYVEDLKRRV